MIAFVLAVSVLMLIPGPNVALITATSMAHGRRAGLITVAGTASAMVVQLALTGLGLSLLLGKAGTVFGVMRWAGAAYLIYLGVQEFRAKAPEAGAAQPVRPSAAMFFRGVLISLTNPKTLFFYAAFFPQFIASGRGAAGQIWLLSGVFLAIALVIDSGWALLAHSARHAMAPYAQWRQRVSGAVLVALGVGMVAARSR